MDEVRLQSIENTLVNGEAPWDAEGIIEQVWRDLDGATSHSHIRTVLMEIALAYENARVKNFVSIFLYRSVLYRLRNELELKQGIVAPDPENAVKVQENAGRVIAHC